MSLLAVSVQAMTSVFLGIATCLLYQMEAQAYASHPATQLLSALSHIYTLTLVTATTLLIANQATV
jgi:hypothetical protein